MKTKGFNVAVIDSSKNAILFGRKKYPDIKFYVGSILKTKFDNREFDSVMLIAVLHCFEKNERTQIINEIKRILKIGGLVFGLVLSNKDKCSKHGNLISKNTFKTDSGKLFHFFTKEELKKEFKRFKIIKIKHNKSKKNNKMMANFTFILKNI